MKFGSRTMAICFCSVLVFAVIRNYEDAQRQAAIDRQQGALKADVRQAQAEAAIATTASYDSLARQIASTALGRAKALHEPVPGVGEIASEIAFSDSGVAIGESYQAFLLGGAKSAEAFDNDRIVAICRASVRMLDSELKRQGEEGTRPSNPPTGDDHAGQSRELANQARDEIVEEFAVHGTNSLTPESIANKRHILHLVLNACREDVPATEEIVGPSCALAPAATAKIDAMWAKLPHNPDEPEGGL